MTGRKPFDPDEILRKLARSGEAPGTFDMRIDADGRWHYQGSPIKRAAMCRLFASILHRASDGHYYLVTPVEQGRIEVEDVPFTAVEMRVEGEGEAQALSLRTNLDDWVEVGPDHPLEVKSVAAGEGDAPYVTVRKGLQARLVRSIFYDLVDLAVPHPESPDTEIGVWSRGRFFALGPIVE